MSIGLVHLGMVCMVCLGPGPGSARAHLQFPMRLVLSIIVILDRQWSVLVSLNLHGVGCLDRSDPSVGQVDCETSGVRGWVQGRNCHGQGWYRGWDDQRHSQGQGWE